MAAIAELAILIVCIAISFPSVSPFYLKLIHRDSIYSPLYPGNLTDEERFTRLSHYDDARGQFLESLLSHSSNFTTDWLIRPWIRGGGASILYMVHAGIGTPPRNYYLAMDTASNLIWIQCQPCKRCFNQSSEIFKPTLSASYRKAECPDPFCKAFPCVDDECEYTYTYAQPATSKGIIGFEDFEFHTNEPNMTVIPNIGFGCGYDNVGFNFKPEVVGIMALGSGYLSLISQHSVLFKSRFSYCLPPSISPAQPPSRLKFGDDAVIPGDVKWVPFVEVSRTTLYFLPLIDISIGGIRLKLPPGTFNVGADSHGHYGGFVIDSGNSFTKLTGAPYDAVVSRLHTVFRRQGMKEFKRGTFDVCYEVPKNNFTSPTMAFHFKDNVILAVRPKNLYIKFMGQYFCAALKPAERISVFGAFQQHDYRFTYDLERRTLHFLETDCSRHV